MEQHDYLTSLCCCQCMDWEQGCQDVLSALIEVVSGGLRSAAEDAELCPELWVLHDVWGGGTELAHVPKQHGECKQSIIVTDWYKPS